MSFCSFKDALKPSIQSRINFLEVILKIHELSKEHCSTCIHYIPPDPNLPGYITDYGGCDLGKDISIGEKANCSSYIEDTKDIDDVKKGLEKLRRELNEKNSNT